MTAFGAATTVPGQTLNGLTAPVVGATAPSEQYGIDTVNCVSTLVWNALAP